MLFSGAGGGIRSRDCGRRGTRHEPHDEAANAVGEHVGTWRRAANRTGCGEETVCLRSPLVGFVDVVSAGRQLDGIFGNDSVFKIRVDFEFLDMFNYLFYIKF
jgi:hypothetical protein